jgi:hypothetical protein
MVSTALTMANTSLSSNGPSRGRWCDSCMCHREACHSAQCAHRAQNSIPTCTDAPREVSPVSRQEREKVGDRAELPRTAAYCRADGERKRAEHLAHRDRAALQCMERRKIPSIALQPLAHSRGHVMATYYWNNSTHSK